MLVFNPPPGYMGRAAQGNNGMPGLAAAAVCEENLPVNKLGGRQRMWKVLHVIK
jgi:hypothetical protein